MVNCGNFAKFLSEKNRMEIKNQISNTEVSLGDGFECCHTQWLLLQSKVLFGEG
jgi:hypothetical protein